jgi:hypothetical protein
MLLHAPLNIQTDILIPFLHEYNINFSLGINNTLCSIPCLGGMPCAVCNMQYLRNEVCFPYFHALMKTEVRLREFQT